MPLTLKKLATPEPKGSANQPSQLRPSLEENVYLVPASVNGTQSGRTSERDPKGHLLPAREQYAHLHHTIVHAPVS